MGGESSGSISGLDAGEKKDRHVHVPQASGQTSHVAPSHHSPGHAQPRPDRVSGKNPVVSRIEGLQESVKRVFHDDYKHYASWIKRNALIALAIFVPLLILRYAFFSLSGYYLAQQIMFNTEVIFVLLSLVIALLIDVHVYLLKLRKASPPK